MYLRSPPCAIAARGFSAQDVARRVQTGSIGINHYMLDPAAPFGGVKASGWGRFGSGQVADEFTNLRWITVSRQPRHYPI